jgi:hypothetical protein
MKGTDWLRARPAMLVSNFDTDRNAWCGTNGGNRYDASDAILLERKDDMKRRGLASPDDGDALALTFAYPVAKRDWAEERRFDEALQKLKRWVV